MVKHIWETRAIRYYPRYHRNLFHVDLLQWKVTYLKVSTEVLHIELSKLWIMRTNIGRSVTGKYFFFKKRMMSMLCQELIYSAAEIWNGFFVWFVISLFIDFNHCFSPKKKGLLINLIKQDQEVYDPAYLILFTLFTLFLKLFWFKQIDLFT